MLSKPVVQDGERVAAPGVHGEVTLVVHLPQVVGIRVFKALPVPVRSLHRVDEIVPMEDVGDGAGAGNHRVTGVQQCVVELATAPRRVALAQFYHDRLHRRRRAPRRVVRPTRAGREGPFPLLGVTMQQGIASGRRDRKASTQRAYVRPRRSRQSDEFTLSIHSSILLPRHEAPPSLLRKSAILCKVCLRTPVKYLSGLYTLSRRGRGNYFATA